MSHLRSDREEKLLEELKVKIDDLRKALDSIGTDALRVKTV